MCTTYVVAYTWHMDNSTCTHCKWSSLLRKYTHEKNLVLLRKTDSTRAITTRHLAGISKKKITKHTFVTLQLLFVHRLASFIEDCSSWTNIISMISHRNCVESIRLNEREIFHIIGTLWWLILRLNTSLDCFSSDLRNVAEPASALKVQSSCAAHHQTK